MLAGNTTGHEKFKERRSAHPLLGGEGRGEGERFHDIFTVEGKDEGGPSH